MRGACRTSLPVAVPQAWVASPLPAQPPGKTRGPSMPLKVPGTSSPAARVRTRLDPCPNAWPGGEGRDVGLALAFGTGLPRPTVADCGPRWDTGLCLGLCEPEGMREPRHPRMSDLGGEPSSRGPGTWIAVCGQLHLAQSRSGVGVTLQALCMSPAAPLGLQALTPPQGAAHPGPARPQPGAHPAMGQH